MKFVTVVFLCTCLVMLPGCSGTDDPYLAFENGDFDRSFNLWMPLAVAGETNAQNYIGIHYYLGLGVERDYLQALKWYGMAAKQGFPDAQRNLGDLYHYGRGIPRDYYTAFIWYFAASQQGNENAKRLLDTLSGENKLTPNQQMHAKLEANEFITDPALRFKSHDTYVDTEKKLAQ